MTDPAKLRLDLPLVLPGIADTRDRCVARLIELLRGRPGIAEAQIVGPDEPTPEVCIHYDPAILSLSRVRELVHPARAGSSAAFWRATPDAAQGRTGKVLSGMRKYETPFSSGGGSCPARTLT